ncbi:hypothetical protein HPB51_013486 [Rhipicephalus microplus]|uniref:Uncharacterized protein n=1 Tax=Rhipicephalus microplus TaxID=6941 RepID=A0A9J6ENC7_RHIMP|nr:transcription factor AP-1-like [Rhipicephalus microplus]KAH8035945.1 hypothetical protein HPB51_013486 [Rhipicephalus microplus]
MVDYMKLETKTETVPGSASLLWSVGSDDYSSGGDSEQQHTMTYQQAQQQLPRCEELCSLMRTVTLGTDNAHQRNSRQDRHPQSLLQPAAGPPMSPFDMRDRESTELKEKRLGRGIVKVKCRRRQLDYIKSLWKTVGLCDIVDIRLRRALNRLRDDPHRLDCCAVCMSKMTL